MNRADQHVRRSGTAAPKLIGLSVALAALSVAAAASALNLVSQGSVAIPHAAAPEARIATVWDMRRDAARQRFDYDESAQ